MINTATELCDQLLYIYIYIYIYIYTTQYDSFSDYQKKSINILNKPENVIFDFVGDNLPPMQALESDEWVKLEPEETLSKRAKLNLEKE